MLDIGFQELLVLMVIALLVFGPYKLPELGRALGRAAREFRRASDEFRSTIETNLNVTDDVPLPPSAVPAPSDAIPDGPSPATDSADRLEPTAVPSDSAATGLAGPEPVPASAELPVEPVDPFCASREGRLLHRRTCAWVSRMPEADRLPLRKASEGWALGLVPCPVCDPRDADGLA